MDEDEDEETVEQVLALIEMRPTDAELYQRLGVLYRHSDEARDAYERSLELDPTDAFTHLYLGNWFHAHQMYSEALKRFQHAAELMPDEAVAHWCLGDVYLALRQYHLAQQAYKTAVKVDPDNEQARDKLSGWHKLRSEVTDETRTMLRHAFLNDHAATTVLLAARWLDAHPNDISAIYDYATMLYQMARYDEAIRVYLDAIERFEEWRWVLYNQMGQLYRYLCDQFINRYPGAGSSHA